MKISLNFIFKTNGIKFIEIAPFACGSVKQTKRRRYLIEESLAVFKRLYEYRLTFG